MNIGDLDYNWKTVYRQEYDESGARVEAKEGTIFIYTMLGVLVEVNTKTGLERMRVVDYNKSSGEYTVVNFYSDCRDVDVEYSRAWGSGIGHGNKLSKVTVDRLTDNGGSFEGIEEYVAYELAEIGGTVRELSYPRRDDSYMNKYLAHKHEVSVNKTFKQKMREFWKGLKREGM